MTNRNGHRQYAALPYKIVDDTVLVMLITSRETKRWVLPKGWPEKKLRGDEVAAKEAFEEAGLVGRVAPHPISGFLYLKRLEDNRWRRCHVGVYPLQVEKELDDWPERDQRCRRWMTPTEAALVVAEAGLAELLRTLATPAILNTTLGGRGR